MEKKFIIIGAIVALVILAVSVGGVEDNAELTMAETDIEGRNMWTDTNNGDEILDRKKRQAKKKASKKKATKKKASKKKATKKKASKKKATKKKGTKK